MTTTNGARIAHFTLAVLGTVLLAAACGMTFLQGMLINSIGDPCAEGELIDTSGLNCPNPAAAKLILLFTPLFVGPGAVVLTWFRSEQDTGYRPRGWAPLVGLTVLAVAWFLVYEVPPFR